MNEDSMKYIINTIYSITGQRVIVAGGCVRDTLMKVLPKDIDCLVYLPPHYTHQDVFALATEMSELLYNASNGSITSQIYQACDKEDESLDDSNALDARWLCCMKVQIPALPEIDILFPVGGDPIAAVQAFDCNLNMVYFDGDKIVGELPTELVWNREVTEERRAKMQAKFDAYKASLASTEGSANA